MLMLIAIATMFTMQNKILIVVVGRYCVVYRFLGSGCYLRGHSHRFKHHNNTTITPKESYSCPIPQDPKGNLKLGIPLNLVFTHFPHFWILRIPCCIAIAG